MTLSRPVAHGSAEQALSAAQSSESPEHALQHVEAALEQFPDDEQLLTAHAALRDQVSAAAD